MKHKLDIADGYDFVAIGISCHLRDHKLAWLLNRHLGWNLVRETLTVRDNPRSGEHSHAVFRYRNEDEHLHFVVLANSGRDGRLLKKQPQYDFFLLVEGYLDMFDEGACLDSLRQVSGLRLAQSLDVSLFEKLQYQVFEG